MKHTIELDDYEVANLRAMIEACGMKPGIPKTPLRVMHTGDWIGTIYAKLPEVAQRPNVPPETLAMRANQVAQTMKDDTL